MHEWRPEGDGCDALRKGRAALPSLAELACAFCARHAGRTVLFVGDSVQGELYLRAAARHSQLRRREQFCEYRCAKLSKPTLWARSSEFRV